MAHSKDRGHDGKRKRKKKDKTTIEVRNEIMHPRMNPTEQGKD
ncbi:MAG: hypothetical protein ACYC0V_10695 [Armatimonadota bacterium]